MEVTPSPKGRRIITARVAKVYVEGLLSFVSESDYEVAITRPFEGFHTGLHIPYFAMQPHRRYVQNNVISKRCYSQARGSLLELFEIGHIILEHREEMIDLLDEYKKKQLNGNSDHRLFRQLFGSYFGVLPYDMDEQIRTFIDNLRQQ